MLFISTAFSEKSLGYLSRFTKNLEGYLSLFLRKGLNFLIFFFFLVITLLSVRILAIFHLPLGDHNWEPVTPILCRGTQRPICCKMYYYTPVNENKCY